MCKFLLASSLEISHDLEVVAALIHAVFSSQITLWLGEGPYGVGYGGNVDVSIHKVAQLKPLSAKPPCFMMRLNVRLIQVKLQSNPETVARIQLVWDTLCLPLHRPDSASTSSSVHPFCN
jgi:hypothetical protein